MLPAKLTLLGIAYEFGGIRVCTATLFELLNLAPSQVAAMTVSGAGAPAAHISQASAAAGMRKNRAVLKHHRCVLPACRQGREAVPKRVVEGETALAHNSQVAISRGLSHMLTLQRSEGEPHLRLLLRPFAFKL